MRSIGLISTVAVAFVSLASIVIPANASTIHRAGPDQYTAGGNVAGGVVNWPAASAGYPKGDQWPHCYGGSPQCTAAGYPNLHYYREMQGLPN